MEQFKSIDLPRDASGSSQEIIASYKSKDIPGKTGVSRTTKNLALESFSETLYYTNRALENFYEPLSVHYNFVVEYF